MKHLALSILAPLLVVAVAAGSAMPSFAAGSLPGPFTGCLAAKTVAGSPATKGQIYNVAPSATSPSSPCLGADVRVTFSDAAGATGGIGPSDAYAATGNFEAPNSSATVGLPEGSYAVTLTIRGFNLSETDYEHSFCVVSLTSAGPPVEIDEIFFDVPPAPAGTSVAGYGTLTFVSSVGPSGGLKIDCDRPGRYDLLAVKVGTTHQVVAVP